MKIQILDQSNLEKVSQNSLCSTLNLCKMHKVWEIGYEKKIIIYGDNLCFKLVSICLYCKY